MLKLTERTTFWIFNSILLLVGLFGLVFIVGSFIIAEGKVSKILGEVGTLFLFVGVFHWLFEFIIKPRLFTEISEHTTSIVRSSLLMDLKDQSLKGELFEYFSARMARNDRIFTSGLFDFIEDSLDTDYSDAFRNSEVLVIGFHHSPRILRDYSKELKSRCASGKKTTIFRMNQNSVAANYEKDHYFHDNSDKSDYIRERLKNITAIIDELNRTYPNSVEHLRHDLLLRYSFVYTDSYIWIKPYRSSKGGAGAPAFVVSKDSALYSFYGEDIGTMLDKTRG